jgi:transposase
MLEMSNPKPCISDDWTCDCKQCDEYWEWMADQETKDIGGFMTTKEYDDELEAEQDGFYEVDGW